MRNLDFSSWQTVLSTLLGLAVITLIGVGIRLLVMQTIQQRRERENRQINERLRTLIAAYKTLGGSFTGNLVVDPSHLRDLRHGAPQAAVASGAHDDEIDPDAADPLRPAALDGPGGEATRSRRRCPTSSCWAPRTRCGSRPRRPPTWWPDAASRPPSWWCRCATSSAAC